MKEKRRATHAIVIVKHISVDPHARYQMEKEDVH